MNSWFTQENIFNLASNLAVSFAAIIFFIRQTKKNLETYSKSSKTNVAERVERQALIDAEITQKMNETRDIVNGDRLLVFEFHNQEHYANGREALRMTCTYENCKSNLQSVKSKFIGIGLSQFPIFLKKLFEKDIVYFDELKDIEKKMPELFCFLSQYDGQGYYAHILKNKLRQPIGFLCIVYNKPVNIQLEIDAEEVARLSFFIEDKIQAMTEKK